MKKRISSRGILLLIVLLGVLPWRDSFADNILSVPVTRQEHSNWCWDASSRSIISYCKGTLVSQCDIANWAWGRNDCCGVGKFAWNHPCNQGNYFSGMPGNVHDVLAHWGVISSYVPSYLSEATVRSELDAGRPFVIGFSWTTGDGHAMVGRGISGHNLYYMDPSPGRGYTISSYRWVVAASDHTWTQSLYLQPDTPSKQTVTIAATDPTASEPNSYRDGTFTVTRTGGGSTTSPLTVNYILRGTATNGIDYEALPRSVTIPAGQSSTAITVTPINDTLVENTETVVLKISGNSFYSVGKPSKATVYINDCKVLTPEPILNEIRHDHEEQWYRLTISSPGAYFIETRLITLEEISAYLHDNNFNEVDTTSIWGDPTYRRCYNYLRAGTYYVEVLGKNRGETGYHGTGKYTIMAPRQYDLVSTDTVFDKLGSLLWQWSGDGIQRSWFDAQKYCSNLVQYGLSNWRLPTQEELIKLRTKSPTYIDPVFKGNQSYYWSSETHYPYAHPVGFFKDAPYRDKESLMGTKYYVRCVADLPGPSPR